MTFKFTPTDETRTVSIKAPFYEEAKASYAPYYESGRNLKIEQAQDQVAAEIAKLGGRGVRFIEGYFGDQPKRHGYLVTFSYGGHDAQIQVAGLPCKGEVTERKLHLIRVQALLNVRDWLKAAVTAQVFAPGSYPLMQYLLIDTAQGQKTLAEVIVEDHRLPVSNPLLMDGN